MQMNGGQRLIAILFAGKPPLSPLSRLSGRQASPRSTIILHLEDTLPPHFHQPDTCPSHTPLPYAIQTVMIAGTPFTNPTSQLHHLKKSRDFCPDISRRFTGHPKLPTIHARQQLRQLRFRNLYIHKTLPNIFGLKQM